jgi:hypothetical protein
MQTSTRKHPCTRGTETTSADRASRPASVPAVGLQRSVGNRAVGRILSGLIQRKATLGTAGDSFEREADAVADRIMGIRQATVTQAAPLRIQRKCSTCEEQAHPLQAQRAGSGAVPSAAVHAAVDAVRGGGQPLAPAVRAFLEPRFGRDFSHVRVHSGGEAARAAQSIDARAYTLGRDIAFAPGEYAPHTRPGMRLLAHELTHTVQQGAHSQPWVQRASCAHDSERGPGCGANQGIWQLVDTATDAVSNVALDGLIVDAGLKTNFGGSWAAQVQTPPNPEKTGVARGFVDGVNVELTGSALRVEVIEVKSRSTRFGGGCARATREARGYVRVLNGIANEIVAVSQSPAARGFEGGRITRGTDAVLRSEGVDRRDLATARAWNFYQSLQARLGVRFSTPLTSVSFDVNRSGTPGTDYRAGVPVGVPCVRNRRPGVKVRQLKFQVNGEGGVSYRCDDTPCVQHQEDEERQEQRESRPITETARPERRRGAARAVRPETPIDPHPDEETPAVRPQTSPQVSPVPQVSDPPVVPILVGTGVVAGAGAYALARRRAARIAAERLALEAARRESARRAGQELWRRAALRRAQQAAAARAGRGALGKAAKAAIYLEVAAAVLVLMDQRAEARVGPGQSSFEALYRLMTTNGAPPSPEMRELIENDPLLRELAENAANGGSPTPLQEAAMRRTLELFRENPDQFAPEDLELLLEMSREGGGTTSGLPPQTEEELRRALEAARVRQRTGANGGSGTPPSGSPGSGGPAAAGPAPGPAGAPPEPETTPEYSGLSAQARQRLTLAPAQVRRLFVAMARGRGGPRVNDDALDQFLATAPGDLTATEVNQLIERLGPVQGQSLDEILDRLRSAVQQIRSRRSDGGANQPAQAEGATDGGTAPPVGAPPTTTPATDPGISQDEYVRRMQQRISSFTGWDAIPSGGVLITASGDSDFGTARVNVDRISGLFFAKNPAGARLAANVVVMVTRRGGGTVDIRITEGFVIVSETGASVSVSGGRTVRNSRLIGGRRR